MTPGGAGLGYISRNEAVREEEAAAGTTDRNGWAASAAAKSQWAPRSIRASCDPRRRQLPAGVAGARTRRGHSGTFPPKNRREETWRSRALATHSRLELVHLRYSPQQASPRFRTKVESGESLPPRSPLPASRRTSPVMHRTSSRFRRGPPFLCMRSGCNNAP